MSQNENRGGLREQGGGLKRSKAQVGVRRQGVLRCYLRGLSVAEVARQVNAPERAVCKDVVQLRNSMKIHFETSQVYTVGLAFAELQEMWREAWLIFHRPAPPNIDPSRRKLAALDRLLKIHDSKVRLAGLIPR